MLIVVEDDDGVRVLVEELLLDRGYNVITAQTGAEGLDRIQREPRLSLVITDIRMPGIDGWELARRATELRADLKVLYITGYPGEQRPHDAPRARCCANRGAPANSTSALSSSSARTMPAGPALVLDPGKSRYSSPPRASARSSSGSSAGAVGSPCSTISARVSQATSSASSPGTPSPDCQCPIIATSV
jgi:CheY-like chemotaxis protein